MELNPNNPVVEQFRGQYHKFVAILMHEMGKQDFEITLEHVEALERDFPNGPAVVLDTRNGGFKLRLVDMKEGEELARKEGGLAI